MRSILPLHWVGPSFSTGENEGVWEGGGREEGVSSPRVNGDERTCNLLTARFAAASSSSLISSPLGRRNHGPPNVKMIAGH